jgi:hypothetical protein
MEFQPLEDSIPAGGIGRLAHGFLEMTGIMGLCPPWHQQAITNVNMHFVNENAKSHISSLIVVALSYLVFTARYA